MADQLFRKRTRERVERVAQARKVRGESWLLVCEGTKTEPNYFKGLLDYANEKAECPIRYRIEGTGMNTKSLVRRADDFLDYTDDCVRNVKIPYGKTFVIFDRDSFEADQFNGAIHAAEKRGLLPIWSNECMELWFLLHFQYFDSHLNREQYIHRLNTQFKHHFLHGYQKNEPDIFRLLLGEGRLKTAMQNARRLETSFDQEPSYIHKCPCTMVYHFVEEVQKTSGVQLI